MRANREGQEPEDEQISGATAQILEGEEALLEEDQEEAEEAPKFSFDKGESSWAPRWPEKNLGKRVFQEMAGNQAFFQLGEELVPKRDQQEMLPERATVKKTAQLLGLTPYAVRRIAKAYEKGGDAEVENLRWGRGRPVKNLFFSQQEIDIMVSRTTLNQQVGMSLKARAEALSIRFGKEISPQQLRGFYKGRGVTLQAPQVRLGPPDLGTIQEQLQRISELQADVKAAVDDGRELICIDESIFNSKGVKRPQWAPVGHPVEHDRRYYPDKYVAVCMATSTLRGVVHYSLLHGQAFIKSLFMAFMRGLHTRSTKQPIAVLLDNCRIHDFEEFHQYCDKFDIQIIWNVKYRPDFNGIEFVWGRAKKMFRAHIDHFKANGLKWNEEQLVEDVLKAIPPAQAVELTKIGFDKIKQGKPVFPQRFLQGPKHNFRLGNLKKILKPSTSARRQFEEFIVRRDQRIAREETRDPGELDPEELQLNPQPLAVVEERDEEIKEAELKESASYSEDEK